MRAKNQFKEYDNYYTEKQLYKMGYKPYPDYDGICLWTNRYCQWQAIYYDIEKCYMFDRKKWEKYCLKTNLKLRNKGGD